MSHNACVLAGVLVAAAGGIGSAAAAVVDAVEFGGDHLFLSADAGEIMALDGGAIPGWKRTGATFPVWSDAGPGRVPVCRFYRPDAGGAGAHFYTAFPDECEALRQGTQWIYEGTAFYAALPQDDGSCADGTWPVARAYNGGVDGRVVHRFSLMDNPPVLLDNGWQAEGVDARTAFCVPRAAPASNPWAAESDRLGLFVGSTWRFESTRVCGPSREPCLVYEASFDAMAQRTSPALDDAGRLGQPVIAGTMAGGGTRHPFLAYQGHADYGRGALFVDFAIRVGFMPGRDYRIEVLPLGRDDAIACLRAWDFIVDDEMSFTEGQYWDCGPLRASRITPP